MAVPKKKTSKSRRNLRRAHDALKGVNVVIDSTTGEYKLPHHVSLKDGFYNGKKVMKVRADRVKSSEDSSESASA
jgi:large subunit ribosomal protein L32